MFILNEKSLKCYICALQLTYLWYLKSGSLDWKKIIQSTSTNKINLSAFSFVSKAMIIFLHLSDLAIRLLLFVSSLPKLFNDCQTCLLFPDKGQSIKHKKTLEIGLGCTMLLYGPENEFTYAD